MKCTIPQHKRKNEYSPTTCLAMVRKLKMTNAMNPKKAAIGFEEQAFRLLTQTRVEKAALDSDQGREGRSSRRS